jgi:predicted deacylase
MSDWEHDAKGSEQIELSPVDIARHENGNTGIPFVHLFEAEAPGPCGHINALTHGNELCGAAALDRLIESGIRPSRGSLCLSFANVQAYQRFDTTRPYASRYVDEDMNRVWSEEVLEGPRQSVELGRARTLRPVMDRADYLLDLHSTSLPAPAMLLCGMQPKGRALARAMSRPVHVVADHGHAAGRRLRDYNAFGDPASPRTAMLAECGQHFEAASAVTAFDLTMRFLSACGTIDHPPGAFEKDTEAQQFIEVTEAVTIGSSRFRFEQPFACFETVEKAGTRIATDGDAAIHTPYDNCVLVMPIRQPMPGQTAVRLGRQLPWD